MPSLQKLVEGLKLSEDQSYISQTECDNVHIPRISEAREDDDLFHDCNDSFESRVTEENHNCEVDSSEKQTDLV
uniref:GekBS199P n=1 Tax=Gekko japonicus TaxID=146911 RepID=Q5EHV2_GEKJA|nr:GekBS199P [Gekko japonicus]